MSKAMRTMVLAGALAAGAGALSACATVHPRYEAPTRVSRSSDAPGPRSTALGTVRPDQAPWRRADGRVPGTMRPYQVAGVTYTPREQPNYDEVGMASWYGPQFHNRSTSNGETFDMDAITAAHRTLPLPSIVEVTNLDNNRTLRVRVNDRGPFVQGRIIDLSRGAARALGYEGRGLTRVRVRYIGPAAPALGDDLRMARATLPPERRTERPAWVAPPAPVQASPPGFANAAPASTSGPLRVQVGAFSTRLNAERAAGQASQAGLATIEPVERDGVTLYRVTLGPADGAMAAQALRDRAAGAGFPAARIIGF